MTTMTTPPANGSANHSAPRTRSTAFDILAEELGAVAGRLEKESNLRIAAAISDLQRRDAERELRLVRLEQAIAERLASVRDGKDGADGKDGLQGEPGPPGESIAGEPGATGPAGKDAAEVTPCGLFDAAASYRRLSIVALDGGSFIAKHDDPGPCPGAGWMLLAGRGKAGKPGERGATGVGKEGPPGLSIVAWREDAAAYTATPIMSDGSEGPALNVRAFLEQFVSEREG